MKPVRVGVAGFSYPDWKGVVYPKDPPDGFDPLRWIACYFDAVEINSSFYGTPRRRSVERWRDTVEDLESFRFTAKLLRLFTHEPEESWDEEEARRFRRAFQPLREAGRLSCLLVQFPFFFDASEKNFARLERIARAFSFVPLVLEVRHRSFVRPEALERVAALGYSFCNIDQPLARDSIPPGDRVTGPIGYFRLHGRNRRAWFRKGAGRDERYDYLYSPRELLSFRPLIERIAERAEETFVIANNHVLGKGPANALELRALLTGRKVEVPPPLLSAYPRLRRIAADPGGGEGGEA